MYVYFVCVALIDMCVCACVCVCVHIYIYIYIYIYICVCVYIYIYIYIYIYTLKKEMNPKVYKCKNMEKAIQRILFVVESFAKVKCLAFNIKPSSEQY